MTPAVPLTEFRNVRTLADTFPLPLVTPLHVFAARRESFDVIVRRTWSAPRVIAALFDALPLAENGWDHDALKIRHIGNSENRYPIWRLERG
jgi:hypothetical protein